MNKIHKKGLVFGSLNIDYVYQVDHCVRPGETISSESLSYHCGGKGVNQAIALAKAGANVSMAGRIGEDGIWLKETCKKYGVDTEKMMIADCPTGKAIIQVDRNGQNCILLYAGANKEQKKEDITKVLDGFESGDYLFLQNEINEIPFLIEEGYNRNMKIVLNPSPFEPEIMDYGLDKLDWLILNEIEAEQMTGEKNSEKMLEKLQNISPNAGIVLTFGADGAMCVKDGKKHWQDSFPCEAIDTTAAGDTFTGYFFSEIMKNEEQIPKALKLAARAASVTVSRQGAAEAIPVYSELKEQKGKEDEKRIKI